MTFASRISHALLLLTAKCPRCSDLCMADPSMRVTSTCSCGAVLTPKRLVSGVSFTCKESN